MVMRNFVLSKESMRWGEIYLANAGFVAKTTSDMNVALRKTHCLMSDLSVNLQNLAQHLIRHI